MTALLCPESCLVNESRLQLVYFQCLFLPSSPQSELPRLAEIDNSLAVFCMATYGEGDPTDNAQDFYDWMQENDEDLKGVNFAVGIFLSEIGLL